MKKLITLTLAFCASVLLSTASHAQEPPSPPSPHHQVPRLPCCKCLGENTTLNLNTGQNSNIDPFWRVNNGPAYTTPAYAGWLTALSPARWIQPVANPRPASNVPPGLYKYTLKFEVPKCTIPGTARLTGKFAADNTVRALLDGVPIPGANCGTIYCFKSPDAPVPLMVANVLPGGHVLTFEVKNQGGPSGLVANVQLSRQCNRE